MEIKYCSCWTSLLDAHYMGCRSWIQNSNKAVYFCRKFFNYLQQPLVFNKGQIKFKLKLLKVFINFLYLIQVNPCHVLCMIHIYLLSNIHHQFIVFKAYLFRIHLFFLHGPLMAVIFPVTNTLFLPGEVATYWIEHILLLTIPIFLLKHYRYISIKIYLDKTNQIL